MKILLLGDFSNCHVTLAEGLRLSGHEVTVGSDGAQWMRLNRDFDTSRKEGKISGAWLYLKALTSMRKRLSGHDIVSLASPNFISLHPLRQQRIFDFLKKQNGYVFLTAMNTDSIYCDMPVSPTSSIKYNEWFISGKPNRWFYERQDLWNELHSKEIKDYHNYFYDSIDGAVSVLYEYHEAIKRRLPPDKIAYGGIPINTDKIQTTTSPERTTILLGRNPNMLRMKGTDYLEEAALRVHKRHRHHVDFNIVEKLSYNDFLNRLDHCHLFLDQIYSYTPATNALLAMAKGKTVVSGGEDDFYNFIEETDTKPIVNAALTVDEIEEQIEQAVTNPDRLAENGNASRQFVVKHNNYRTVAQRFINFWEQRMNAR